MNYWAVGLLLIAFGVGSVVTGRRAEREGREGNAPGVNRGLGIVACVCGAGLLICAAVLAIR